MKSALFLAASALVLAGCAVAPDQAAPPVPSGGIAVAITIDDLPVHGPLPPGMTALQVNRQMVDAIQAGRLTGATAFVNGRWTSTDPETAAALDLWKAAGIPLANHTWSHPNLNALSVDAYKQEIAGNEPLLKRYAEANEWRWFRFPFLAEGDDPAKRSAIRSYLADRGYRIASVSMDFSDWKFTAAYARCKAASDTAAIARMEDLYLEAAKAELDHSRTLAQTIYKREIPLVQLMHVGAFSAHMMPRLIALYRSAGVRFVSLEDAQADPAYAEDNDPRLPPRPHSLGARAEAIGISVPPPPDPAPLLNAMCAGAGPMTASP